MALLIRQARIVDPSQSLDAVGDILISQGRIAACGEVSQESIDALPDRDQLERIDGSNLVASPGWVDMHAHLREPGDENAETIASGARAAARGGYTSVACLPDTNPPIDSESAVEYVRLQSDRAGGADVFAIAALTKGRCGESLAELGQLSKAGALAFSDCRPIQDSGMLLKGLQYASMFDLPVIDIPREASLSGGVMNSGKVATLAGLSGSPPVSEELAVVRGCLLAREADARYHVAHVSTVGAVKRLEEAKEDGIQVSASAAPYNLLLTDELLRERFDTRYKLRPPLRGVRDIDAILFGIRIGVVDCIVSAHAPIATEGKAMEFDLAPFGGSTLEVTLSAAIESMHHRAGMSLSTVVAAASTNPAKILGLKEKGSLAVGSAGDIVLFDADSEVEVDARDFISRSKVSPYDGMTLRGKVVTTIVGGKRIEV